MSQRIFDLLDESGQSQKDLAAAIGVSTGNVSDWKIGRARPSVDVLKRVADHFGVTVDYLIERTDVRDLNGYDDIWNTGILHWLNDKRMFSSEEQDALKKNFIEMISKYKVMVNELAVANRSQSRKAFLSDDPIYSDLVMDTCHSIKSQMIDVLRCVARVPCDFNAAIFPDAVKSPDVVNAVCNEVGLLPENTVRSYDLSEDAADLLSIWNALDRDAQRIVLGVVTQQKQRMAADAEKHAGETA